MRVAYIAMMGVPSARAQSVHVMKMADALNKLGKLHALILPWRKVDLKKLYEYYNTSEILVVFLPCLDLMSFAYSRGVRNSILLGILFRIKHVTFAFSVFFYMFLRRGYLCWTREPLLTVIAKALSYTTIFDVHGLLSFPRTLMGSALQRADLCVALTPSLGEVIRNYNQNIIIAGDCIDLGEFERSEPVDLGEGQHIVYIGWLSEEKGVYDLIKAWRLLAEANRHLWLVGGGDVWKVKNFINELGLTNIHVTGPFPHSEAIRYYEAATIAVVPTRKTPFFQFSSPLKLFEAAASKKPIVASKIEGNKEFIEDGVNGLLFEEGKPRDLAKKIDQLLKNEELRQRVATFAYERVKKHTWENRAQAVLVKLKSILSRTRWASL